jgi:hypothetical protein
LDFGSGLIASPGVGFENLSWAVHAGLVGGGGDPPPTAGSLFKTITCPAYGATVLSAGERVDIDDIIVSANQDQIVTVKFNPPDFIITKLSMKARESAVINISGKVESLEEQSLQLDCSGTGNLFITVVGSKTGM